MVRVPRLSLVLLALTSAFLLTAGPCGDDGGTSPDDDTGNTGDAGAIPADWAGTWDVTSDVRDCTSGEVIIPASTSTEILCPDGTLDTGTDEGSGSDCTESFSGNTYTSTCESTSNLGGCTATFQVETTITRNDNSYSGSSTVTTTISGGGDCGNSVTCSRYVFNAVRTGPVGANDCASASPVPFFARSDFRRDVMERAASEIR